MRIAVLIALGCALAPISAASQTAADTAATRVSPLAEVPVSPPASGPAITPPRIGGYLQARSTMEANVGLTNTLNRSRVSAVGTLPARFSYRLLVEYQASAGRNLPATVSLREAIVQWNAAPFTIAAGEFKTPFSREYLILVPQLEVADLAVAIDTLAPKYDMGVMAEYAVSAYGTISLGVFNGEGANSIANRDSTAMLVGRVAGRPLPELSLGMSATYDGPDSMRWGADVQIDREGAMFRAEYLNRHVRGRSHDDDDDGWTFLAGYRLAPRVQLVGRYEGLERPRINPASRTRAVTLAVNYFIASNRVRLLGEWIRRERGQARTSTDQFIAQIQAQF